MGGIRPSPTLHYGLGISFKLPKIVAPKASAMLMAKTCHFWIFVTWEQKKYKK